MATDTKSNIFGKPTVDGDTIKMMIASVKGRSDTLQADIQCLLASCIIHIMKHGDITLANTANDAIASLSKGWRINAARQYLVDNGPLTWDSEDEKLVYSKRKMEKLKPKYEEDQKVFIRSIMEDKWYDKRPETPFEGYSLVGKLMAAVNLAEKHLEDNEKKALIRDADKDIINKMKSFFEQFTVTAKPTTATVKAS